MQTENSAGASASPDTLLPSAAPIAGTNGRPPRGRRLRDVTSTPRARTGGAGRWFRAFVLLALGTGAGWALARRGAASTPAAPRAETAAVERRDVDASVLATGVVRPAVGAQVAVGSRASGILKRLHVTVGDRVRAGDLLAELDAAEVETRVAQAEAALANAAAEREFAAREHERVRELVSREMSPATELSAARRALEVATAREREASAALSAARVQLEFTRIRAPIAGVVGTVSTQEGETVAASFAAPTFLTIVDLARLQVWAYVDETDVGRIAVGQRATFTVDAWPDARFRGRVVAVRPTAELRDNVVNYVTLIEIDPASTAGHQLRPEMTATVNVALDGRRDALSVPNGALRRDGEGSYVLVQSATGADRRAVRLGFRGSAFTEVLDGARQGDRVVLGSAQTCDEQAPTPAPAVTFGRPGA